MAAHAATVITIEAKLIKAFLSIFKSSFHRRWLPEVVRVAGILYSMERARFCELNL